eukprot:TRINITY_DN8119_c0_g1_i2.p1 TRINITY_DN8119_c0_g1~~TRINITY_DN8119_c0_g1_i2.p1  ORF type:complete len:225 (-),score=31.89 TRINITY_DN8119_c0_g1_i2:205-879(-)
MNNHQQPLGRLLCMFLLTGLAVLCFASSYATAQSEFTWKRYFTDDFNRPNGNPGSNWTTPLGNQPPVYINDGQLCGAGQSVGILSFELPFPSLRFSFNFTSISTTGFETYVLGTTDDQQSIFYFGCDGGYQGAGYCTPTIASLNGTQLSGKPTAMNTDTSYFFQVIWTSTGVQFDLFLSDELIATISLQNPEPIWMLTRFGVIIGRDTTPSCISNFALDVGSEN